MSQNEDHKYSVEKFSKLVYDIVEANAYGQFADDYNQPLSQHTKADIRSLIDYLPSVEHILKTNPFDKEQQSTIALALTDEDFFEDFVDEYRHKYEDAMLAEYKAQEDAIESMVGIEHYAQVSDPCQTNDNETVIVVTPAF